MDQETSLTASAPRDVAACAPGDIDKRGSEKPALEARRHQAPYLVIEPPNGWQPIDFKDLWRYRDMIWLSVLRDITSRYKQTALGPIWIVLMPLISAGLFSIVFGTLADLPSGGIPYAVLVYAGTLIWNLFSRAFGATAGSISSNEHLITKVYFPRLVAPISGSLGGVLDFGLGLVVLAILMWLTNTPFQISFALAPLFGLLAILTGMGLGLWIAAASVRIRDLRHAAGFFIQVAMWAAPVVYSSQIVFGNENIPARWRPLVETLYQINPLFPMIEGFRWATLGDAYRGTPLLTAISLGMGMLILVGGMFYFRRVESTVADCI